MILVSCRKDFSSDRLFNDQNVIRDYPNPANLGNFIELDEATLLTRADGRHVLVLVHGYRSPLKNVVSSYHDLARNLAQRDLLAEGPDGSTSQYGLVVGFAWPGFKTRLVGFFAARPWASRSGGYLRALIQTLRRAARTVDIQTHSLGARVALQAVSTDNTLWVDNLMMAAPAVDDECLQPSEEFNEILDSCNRVFVYHSKHDPVLKTYMLASIDRALGAKGPENKRVTLEKCLNVYVVDCQAHVKAHGDYRKKPAYYGHWSRVMNQQQLDRYATL